MSEQEVDALLARMSKIAEAVNAFKSETVQQAALSALIAAFETGASVKPRPTKSKATEDVRADDLPDEEFQGDTNSARNTTKRPRRAKGGSNAGGTVQPVRDLDLRPKGVESFEDFITKKQPRDNQERFAVAVYYLEQVANVTPITLGHLAAVFKQTNGWREPVNIKKGVQMTGFRKNTIDTSDTSNLRTTPHGRNFVEHDLPATATKKRK